MYCVILLLVLAWPCVSSDIFDAIDSGNFAGLSSLLSKGGDANARLQDGTTALMRATVAGDAAMVRLLLDYKAGAKTANSNQSTALHWAAHDLEKVRLLVAAGADVNALTKQGRSALVIAAEHKGSAPILSLLIENGVNPKGEDQGAAALSRAAFNGDLAAMRVLIGKGVAADARNSSALQNAAQSGCPECVRFLLVNGASAKAVSGSGRSPLFAAAQRGSIEIVQELLEQGAAPDPRDREDRTPLQFAVQSDYARPEIVKMLLDHGADANHKNSQGESARSLSRRQGHPEIARMFGEKPVPASQQSAPAQPEQSFPGLEPAIQLLQASAPAVFRNRGCVSCHNNALPMMVAGLAQKKGIAIDTEIMSRELKSMRAVERARMETTLIGSGVGGSSDTIAYTLLGMAGGGQSRDSTTDAMVHYLTARQSEDGNWHTSSHRPPQEYSDITVTALSIRAIQLFAPPGRKQEIADRVARARRWLRSSAPSSTEESAMRLMGLAWTGAARQEIDSSARQLVDLQLANGAWRQLPTLAPDAYATGQALYALKLAAWPSNHESVKKARAFLQGAQAKDSSWFVQSRAIPFQPYFESGFPYGQDQWISAAGSSWAVLALLESQGRAVSAEGRTANAQK